jgi:succinate dehydrogenase / fumarate reductase cytochrome b subunit
MSRFSRIANNSIGRKLLMAATGLGMVGFVIGHLLGNLKMFFGPEEINSYAEFLHQHPGLIWPVRLGLLAFLLLHVVTGVTLWSRNRAARPTGYYKKTTLRASLASRFMLTTGVLLLAFVIYHLLHFTFLAVHNEASLAVDSAGRHDVYTMVVHAFKNPLLAGGYVLAMAMLGQHLWHGVASLLQTLGLHHSAYNRPLRGAAKALVVLVVLGFVSLPISIFFGLLPSVG